MGIMSYMSPQNEIKDTGRHYTYKLPSILSKMWSGDTYHSTTFECKSYQGARRTDAEPIARSLNRLGACYQLLIFAGHISPSDHHFGVLIAVQRESPVY